MNPDGEKITYFGITDARGKRVQFGIKAKDRTKHMYVIGKTGMGKSTLLENMAIQDIQSGNGLAFIDPHGGTAEKLLDYIPKERIDDVIYFAPFDMAYPISFNIMEDVGPDKRFLVVDGLMSVFEKIWVDAWSARMAYILKNTLLALLEYPDSTLLGVNRLLADKDFRKLVVANVSDPSVKSFWVDEFAKYTDRFAAEATPAIQNKIGQFTSNPLIRNVIGQPKSSFDFRKLMDTKKIFIANLSKGLVGEGNARLLGAMLVTKIYLSAMSRADLPAPALQKLPDFYLYVDEFQSFANKSFADILSEARKYKLSLTMAHQYVEQMEEEVRDAVFGNVGTTITFRVGPLDAELLEKVFTPQFTAEDLVNLGLRQIYLSLQIDGIGSPPFSATSMPPIPQALISYKDQVIDRSRKVYGHPRAEVEDAIRKWHEPLVPTTPLKSAKNDKISEASPSPARAPERRPPPGPALKVALSEALHKESDHSQSLKANTENRPLSPKPPMRPLSSPRVVNREPQKSFKNSISPSVPIRSARDKGPSPKHMAALRDALQSVIKDTETSAKSTLATPAMQPVLRRSSSRFDSSLRNHSPKSPPQEEKFSPKSERGNREELSEQLRKVLAPDEQPPKDI